VLETDGVHLSALSGYQFVHFLFDSAFSAVTYAKSSLDQKVEADHQDLLIQGSRLALLEQQFASYRSQKDLEFAVQQEHNDWLTNIANESFFVISGLPPAPGKLTGGTLSKCILFSSYCLSFVHSLLRDISCLVRYRNQMIASV